MKQNANIKTQINQALQLAKNNKPKEALVILEELYSRNKSDEDLLCMLGIAHIQLNNLSNAENYFQHLLKSNKTNPAGYFYLAEIFRARKESKEALDFYLKAANLASDANLKVKCLSIAAEIAQALGLEKQAAKHYDDLLAIQPDNPTAYYNKALLKQDSGNTEEAIECYTEAITYNKDYFFALNNLASLLMEEGRYKKAEEYYRRALSLQPDSLDVMMNLGHVLCRQEASNEAIALYSEVSKRKPDHFIAWARLGVEYNRIKNQEESVRCYKKALEIEPDNEDIQFQLATTGNFDPSKFKVPPASFVANLFDGYANKFDQHIVQVLKYQTPEKIFSLTKPLISPANNLLEILDLGCGTGLCGKLFHHHKKHMTGVDLSPKMIDKARLLNCYDDLIVGDIMTSLEEAEGKYDLVLSADVFIYIGDLDSVFSATARSLKSGGLFAFSVESEEGDSFVLRESGRYAHPVNYIRRLLSKHGFEEVVYDAVVLRTEAYKDMKGNIVVLRNRRS